jgi:superfamily I DNA/RNA helicase
MITPSQYQKDILDFVESDYRNLIVNAVPGSGKTTTVVMALKKAYGKSIATAFNKAIETELSEKAPKYAKVKTLNALGHGLLCRNYDHVRINKNKFYNSIKKYEDDTDEKIPFKMVSPLKTFFDKCRSYGFGINIKLTQENLDKYFSFFQIDLDLKEGEDEAGVKAFFFRVFKEVFILHNSDESEFDFNDQIYFPVLKNITAWKYDNIFVDEAQDISPIQLSLVELFCNDTTRLFFVGDRNQSIYAFRGADHRSMDTIKEKFKCTEMPLSISYRCPEKVLSYLKVYTPEMEGKDNNEEGTVDSASYSPEMKFPEDSLILCRTNAPLVKVGTDLLARGQNVSLNNPELRDKLLTFVKTCKNYSMTRILELARDEYKRWEKASALRKDLWYKALEYQEIYQSLNSFIDISDDTNGLISNIDKMFTYRTGCVQLLTVHKAKGLESDNVYIINDELFSKFGKTDDELAQEKNCRYVALSRSKKNLTFLEVPMFTKKD